MDLKSNRIKTIAKFKQLTVMSASVLGREGGEAGRIKRKNRRGHASYAECTWLLKVRDIKSKRIKTFTEFKQIHPSRLPGRR